MKKLKTVALVLLITLFSCTEENYYYNNENLGRVNIYIEGNLTNEQLVEKLNNELGIQTENIYIERTSLITDVVLDTRISENLRKIIFADSNTGLRNISITGKGSIRTLSISSSYQNSIIRINGFEEIDIVQFFTVSDQNLNKTTNILVEDLEIVNSQLTFNSSEQTGNSISLPHLKKVIAPNFEKSFWRGIWNSINMPKLEEMSQIYTSVGGSFTGVPIF